MHCFKTIGKLEHAQAELKCKRSYKNSNVLHFFLFIYPSIRYVWGRPMRMDRTADKTTKECLIALDVPDCMATPFSRDNHLGNGVDLEALRYDWILPYFPSGIKQRVVLRLRLVFAVGW